MVQDKKDLSYISCVLRLRKEYRIDPEEYLNLVEEPSHDASKVVAEIMKEPGKDVKEFYPTDMGFVKKGSVDLTAPGVKDKVTVVPGDAHSQPDHWCAIGAGSGDNEQDQRCAIEQIPMNDQ
jgi:hypothetical protein